MAFYLYPNTTYTPTEFPQLVTNDITVGSATISNTAYKLPVIKEKKSQTMFLNYSSVYPAFINKEYLTNISGVPITSTLPRLPRPYGYKQIPRT
jgi:hypothetical protein